MVSPVVTVNDVGHGSPAAQYQTTPMVRVGNAMYFLYRRADDPTNRTVYGRRLDLTRLSPPAWDGPAVRVFDADVAADEGHRHPTIVRDARGQLVALWNWADWDDLPASADGSTIRSLTDPAKPPAEPRFGISTRVIPRWEDRATWAPQAEVPSRIANEFGWQRCPLGGGSEWATCGAGMHDLTAAYDPLSGCTYVVGELYNHGLKADGKFDGVSVQGGLPRALYRVCGDATQRTAYDGPYMVIRSGLYPAIPLGTPPGPTAGNVFTKGTVKLGHERTGAKSLHLVWHKHATFVIENEPGDWGVCGTGLFSDDDDVQWDWDVMYARSPDGGRTWCNFAGTRCVAKTIEWNDDAFRVFAGDVDETAGYSWALGPDDRPVFLVNAWDGMSGQMSGDPSDPARWHVDWNPCPNQPNVLTILKLVSFDPAVGAFVARAVETWAPYADYPRLCEGACGRTSVAVAPGGEIYLFREGPPRYRKSADGGRTWGEWVRFDDPSQHTLPNDDEGWRMTVTDDSEDPGLVHVLYQSIGTRTDAEGLPVGNLYHYVNLRIGEPPGTPDADGDGLGDARDNCPTLANGPAQLTAPGIGDQADRDGDGVGDACDNCVFAPNPPVAAAAFQTTTGGQLDDDGDGRGNFCDADFNGKGAAVDSADFAMLKRAFGRSRSSTVCGRNSRQPCDRYDLDNAGSAIDGADLAAFRGQYGKLRGRKCPTCGPPWPNAALPCVGDSC